jgi:hypothetical protein
VTVVVSPGRTVTGGGEGLLFPHLMAAIRKARASGTVSRTGVKPARQRGVDRQPGRFPSQIAEDFLRDILSLWPVALRLAQGGRKKIILEGSATASRPVEPRK